MKHHVRYDYDIFTNTEKAIDIRFTIFVMTVVEKRHETSTNKIELQGAFFDAKRFDFLIGFEFEPVFCPQKVCKYEVNQT